MKMLYSNILPLGTEEGQQTIIDCFKEQLSKSDRLEIAVGYVSRASLEELDSLITEYNIKSIFIPAFVNNILINLVFNSC